MRRSPVQESLCSPDTMLPLSIQSRRTDSHSAPDDMGLHRPRMWTLYVFPARPQKRHTVHHTLRVLARKSVLVHFSWFLNKWMTACSLERFPSQPKQYFLSPLWKSLPVGRCPGPRRLENVHCCSKDLSGWWVLEPFSLLSPGSR